MRPKCSASRSTSDHSAPQVGKESMRKSILLVDDNAKIRELVRQFLEAEPGFRVCGQAIDGRDAIEKAQRLKPDLIILDQAMPVMTGVESARVLSKIMPHVPLLLFTLHSEE